MSTSLRAHHEWASRPADQRFQTVQALLDAVRARQEVSRERPVELQNLIVETNDLNGVVVRAKDKNVPVAFTNWSFDQFSRTVGAPAYYLNKLPAELAAQNLNHGIQTSKERNMLALLSGTNETGHRIRALTSERYARVWDREIVEWAADRTTGTGWELPLAYSNGKFGAEKVPSGAYASDRDVFLFMVDYSKAIEVKNEQLFRGFYAWNSEVGSKSFGLEFFLFRMVCGNHIVHGFNQVARLSKRHIGKTMKVDSREQAGKMLDIYMNSDTSAERNGIRRALEFHVKEDDKVAWLRQKGFAKHEAEGAIAAIAEENEDRDSLWGLTQGLTAYARQLPNLDDRADLDARAGRLLALAN